ncbi:MAG: tripartite tricarboxylate transporter TctB family protein [Alphaproteobacteria bacterium]|nr:tripartite tricarboxylate transporter TctB family protein [Alphaproteobacteria bacterium]
MSLTKTEARSSLASGLLPRERAAGLLLILIGAVAFWSSLDLPAIRGGSVGAGLMPRLLGIIITSLGVAQLVLSIRSPGPAIAASRARDIVMLLGAVILFAITIRGYPLGAITIPPLGIVVAGPLAVITAGLAARDVRIAELVIFGIVMSAACLGLFRYVLGLPLPVAPWLIGY